MKICSFTDCGRKHSGNGYCAVHAAMLRRGTTPLVPIKARRSAKTPEQRFRARYERDGNGCWVWDLICHPNGYGQFHVDGANHYAHRWAYEHFVGPIPSGLVLDHLCRNRACVNPDHLEPVTQRENVQRGGAGESARRLRAADVVHVRWKTPIRTRGTA